MKNILIIFFIASVLNAQALELIYDGETPKWAIDLDASTEYAYKNTPTGLDLNGSEMITATADRDFSGAGNWSGITVTGGVGTFTTSASLPSSAYTDMESGKNYTIQLDAKSNGVLGSELWDGTYSTANTDANNTISGTNTVIMTSTVPHPTIPYLQFFKAGASGNSYTVEFDVIGKTGTANFVFNALGISIINLAVGHYSYTGISTGNAFRIQKNDANTGSLTVTNITIKQRTYSSFKVVIDNDSTTLTTTGTSATKAFTFTYSGGSQTVQLKGVGTDTWTADNITITEKYDLEIEGNFKANNIATAQYILSTSGGDNIRLGLSSSKLYFRPDNSQSSSYVYSSTLSSNTWYKYKVNYSGLSRVANCYINGVSDNGTQSTASTWLNKEAQTSLHIGAMSTTYFSGLIGETKITRKDGTGAVVSTSIYDWNGTSATFLNDKGTNGNNLTGVNVTTADQVKFSGGKYK